MLRINKDIVTVPYTLEEVKESFIYSMYRPMSNTEWEMMEVVENGYTLNFYLDMMYDIAENACCKHIEVVSTHSYRKNRILRILPITPIFHNELEISGIIAKQISTYSQFINENIKFEHKTKNVLRPHMTFIRCFDGDSKPICIFFTRELSKGIEIRLVDFKY